MAKLCDPGSFQRRNKKPTALCVNNLVGASAIHRMSAAVALLLTATGASHCCSQRFCQELLHRPFIAPRRAVLLLTASDPDLEDANTEADGASKPLAWPEPAATVSELQEAAAKAQEAAEAKAKQEAAPFTTDGGGFSPVALATFLVFVAGGALFFQGISGGGALKFADDQPPEVQACIKRATTRAEASQCLPPVPLT